MHNLSAHTDCEQCTCEAVRVGVFEALGSSLQRERGRERDRCGPDWVPPHFLCPVQLVKDTHLDAQTLSHKRAFVIITGDTHAARYFDKRWRRLSRRVSLSEACALGVFTRPSALEFLWKRITAMITARLVEHFHGDTDSPLQSHSSPFPCISYSQCTYAVLHQPLFIAVFGYLWRRDSARWQSLYHASVNSGGTLWWWRSDENARLTTLIADFSRSDPSAQLYGTRERWSFGIKKNDPAPTSFPNVIFHFYFRQLADVF